MEFFPRPWSLGSLEESHAALEKIEVGFAQRGFGIYALECDEEFAGIVGLSVPTFDASFTPHQLACAKLPFLRESVALFNCVSKYTLPCPRRSFVAQLLKISSAYTPPPPEGFLSRMMWGVESHIVERFEQTGVPKEQISLKEDTFLFVSPNQGRSR
jgi:hypothetical protein